MPNPITRRSAVGSAVHASMFAILPRITAALLLVAGAISSRSAEAGAIVVGRSGLAGNCTVPTIQAAIDRADDFGGYNLILVTNDVPDGVWHENLKMENLRSDLSLEIVGGFNNCAELASTGGTADIYGGDAQRPVLKIRGYVDATLRGLAMEGGSPGSGFAGGIDFEGHGRIELNSVRLRASFGNGLFVDGSGGEARVDISGNVEIVDQFYSGIFADGTSVLSVHGDGNAIHRNAGNGIRILSPAVADIGTSGNLLYDNAGYGLFVAANATNSGRTTRLYSTSVANPLKIQGNTNGAIYVNSVTSPYQLCTKNISITANANRAIYLEGRQAQLDMNTDCDYPPEANFPCVAPGDGGCNSIDRNTTFPGKPLIAAVDGARISIDRMRIVGNSASSILSTNLGTATSASSITMTNSVVANNALRDNLFESLNGGIIDIYDATVAGNTGSFGLSLVGIDPALLQVTNSIIDQPQLLMDVLGNPATSHVNRVMVRNTTGAHAGDELILNVPSYIPNSLRLQPTSPGVDYAPAGGGVDYDGNPRDVDTIGMPNVRGPRDLGAYESQATSSDRIFLGDFEASP